MTSSIRSSTRFRAPSRLHCCVIVGRAIFLALSFLTFAGMGGCGAPGHNQISRTVNPSAASEPELAGDATLSRVVVPNAPVVSAANAPPPASTNPVATNPAITNPTASSDQAPAGPEIAAPGALLPPTHPGSAPFPTVPLRTVQISASSSLPFRPEFKLPPLCQYEPPDSSLPPEKNKLDLGDLALQPAAAEAGMPTAFLDAIPAPAFLEARSLVSGIDDGIKIESVRRTNRPDAQEWRIHVLSTAHASGGEHWVLALLPARSRWLFRMDWDNTHLWASPGHQNSIFEEIADHIRLTSTGHS